MSNMKELERSSYLYSVFNNTKRFTKENGRVDFVGRKGTIAVIQIRSGRFIEKLII